MDMSMMIEEFNALLTSELEKDDSPLLAALRKHTTIEKTEDIAALDELSPDVWMGWV